MSSLDAGITSDDQDGLVRRCLTSMSPRSSPEPLTLAQAPHIGVAISNEPPLAAMI